MADESASRRSNRPNKGIPPARFPAKEEMCRPASHRRAASKSVKSNSTVRRREIEVSADEELQQLKEGLTDKEQELKLAENRVTSIQRRIERMQSGDHDSSNSRGYNELLEQQMDAEERVDQLKIELEALQKKSEGRMQLINRKKELELEKVESDDDNISYDSSEERNKMERVNKWVTEDTAANFKTPMHRVTADATKSKIVPYSSTPVNPYKNEDGENVAPKNNRRRPVTESYEASSEENDGNDDNGNAPADVHEGNAVSMRDLVDALKGLTGTRDSSQVIMKTTIDKDLPKFGGDPSDWIQFKSEFHRTTSKYKMDDSENMARLRKALTNDARSTVKAMMVNPANVNSVMDALEKRFGRPRIVLTHLAEKAKACNNVSILKPNSIIEFGLAVQALVANVESYKEDGFLNSVELLDTLVKKLSPDLATRWFEWLAADTAERKENLSGFCKWVTAQLDIAYQRADVKVDEKFEERKEQRRRRGPGCINATSGEDERCPCCERDNHPLSKCWAFKKKSLDDKWKIIKSTKACICCLRIGHRASECDDARDCKLDSCSKQHHRLLHRSKKKEVNNDGTLPEKDHPPEDVKQTGNSQLEGNFAVITGCDGPLPIVPIKVNGPLGTQRCYALLDCGASRSLIRRDLADKLGLSGDTITYSYRGISGETITENKAKKINCKVSSILRGSKYCDLRSAITVEDIKMKPFSMDVAEIKRKWPYLRGVSAKSLVGVIPDIIVGNNNPHLILARKILQGNEGEPIGWRAELGWAISGEFGNDGSGMVNVISGDVGNDVLHQLIKQSFSFEDFGVKTLSSKGKNLDEKRAYQILEKTTRKVGNAWETGLLWRDDEVVLPESESTAMMRLQYTERKMRDPEYRKSYCGKIDEYLSKGYLKKLSKEEAVVRTSSTYTIPHFGVTNPNKPGKFRLVLDAKSKSHGVSLNDKLLTGPDLIRSLVGVLWRFRRHRVALTGDISDMFHRVMIRKEDRDSQRILWRNGDSTRSADVYQMWVMIFGATSSPSCAIYVKNRNADLFKDKFPTAVDIIINDFYVDDCLTGGNSEEEVISLRKQISEINASGNFTVCKWMSSSREVLESIPVDLRAEEAKCFQSKEDIAGERVLGMWWNPVDDVFQFKLTLHKVKKEILEGEIPTKRQMCGLIMSLFDPVGFISHYKIKGMILLQEVWSSGIGWDDEIPVTTYGKWQRWLTQLEDVKNVKVSRCYSDSLKTADDIQFHTFVDASSEAISCICYLRVVTGDKVEVSFVSAKARVAPLKKSTIPRLELQAALMGARLADAILEELKIKINTRWFWSDSSTVLQWLKSRAGKLKEFVANRIGEIQEITNLNEWHWIPTKLNIADIATRFESEISFNPQSDWFRGPSFLYDDPSSWNFSEKREKWTMGTLNVSTGAEILQKQEKVLVESITTPAPSRLSSYIRLLRSTAAVRRAAFYWLGKTRKEKNISPPWTTIPREERDSVLKCKYHSNLMACDLVSAKKQLMRLVQGESFAADLEILRHGGQLSKKGTLWRLNPVLDEDGIIRVDGRIGKATGVPESCKFPIILPARHWITDLIVDLEHNRCAHQGVETVLGNLRQTFWIVDARHTVKRSWQRCQRCHLAKCKPVVPKMGILPISRLASRQPPFTYTGIDLFGPHEVTVGRHHEKRWGVLMCCMVTRAVHLEVVHSLSTDEVIMALSRFIDTRGRPSEIQSDNGTNFVGAAKELKEQWENIDFARIQETGTFQEIKWVFNPPAAPHMGGAWERLIQTVKKCLYATLRNKYPKDTTLLTVIKSVENLTNSRPLTYISCDPSDDVILTPNHFLRGSTDAGPGIPCSIDCSDKFLREQWKRSQVLTEQYWERWTKYYLPKLIRREKWLNPVEPIQVGALVFVVDETLPRNCWTRGYISQTFPGNDGQVRTVEVATRNSTTKKISFYRRPVAKVCPLGLTMEIKKPGVP